MATRFATSAVLLLLTLLAGCATTPGASGPQHAWALQQWAATRPLAAPGERPGVVLVGITVHDFPRSADLRAWRHSRQALAAAAQQWLGLPAAQVIQLEDPRREDLDELFTRTLPARLHPGDVLVLYLGTHQRRDGRILLAHGEATDATQVAKWLAALPQRQVLLADLCYGERLEAAAAWPAHICRIYASHASDEATEVLLDRTDTGAAEYFADTTTVMAASAVGDERRYSLLGLLWLQALREQLTAAPSVVPTAAQVYTRLAADYRQLQVAAPLAPLPAPSAVNLRDWPLGAAPRPAAQHAGEGPPPAAPVAAPADWDALTALLAEPRATPLDLAQANFLMGRIYDPTLDVPAVNTQLDALATTLRPKLAGVTDPAQQVAIINRALFSDLELKADKEPYGEDFLLHVLLRTHHSRCGGLTALYLALGERLHLPLVAVCLPEHVFVRWPAPPAGGPGLNIETTFEGVAVSDADYRRIKPWPSTPAADAFYLTPLTPRQTVAMWLSALSNALREQGRAADARHAAELAVGVNPGDAEAWNNLGMAAQRLTLPAAAEVAYLHALAVNPALAEAWNNLADAKPLVADRVPLYKKAVQAKPTLGIAWRNLAYAYYETQQYQLAWAAAQRCRELAQPIPADFLAAVQAKLPK